MSDDAKKDRTSEAKDIERAKAWVLSRFDESGNEDDWTNLARIFGEIRGTNSDQPEPGFMADAKAALAAVEQDVADLAAAVAAAKKTTCKGGTFPGHSGAFAGEGCEGCDAAARRDFEKHIGPLPGSTSAIPARLDEDGTAKPLTEIREVFPAGDGRERALFHGAGESYVLCASDAPTWNPEWKKVWLILESEEGTRVYTDQDMADHDLENYGATATKVGPFVLATDYAPARNVALADAIVRSNAETADLIEFAEWVAHHPDIGDSLTAATREVEIQAAARRALGVPGQKRSDGT